MEENALTRAGELDQRSASSKLDDQLPLVVRRRRILGVSYVARRTIKLHLNNIDVMKERSLCCNRRSCGHEEGLRSRTSRARDGVQ